MSQSIFSVRAPAENSCVAEGSTPPAVSTAAAETFWTSGTDARSPEPSVAVPVAAEQTQAPFACCVGVDEPGLGRRHAANCARARNVAEDERAYASGKVGAKLRKLLLADERDGLLARLIFAARDLAQSRINFIVLGDFESSLVGCRECRVIERPGALKHTASCRAGRVLNLITELVANAEAGEQLNRKEDAGGPEPVAAGEEIPLSQLKDQQCNRCGQVGGVWEIQHRPDVEVDMSLLGLNQRVGAPLAAGRGHSLYTHHCEAYATAIELLRLTGRGCEGEDASLEGGAQ